jgi:hypothetical protein
MSCINVHVTVLHVFFCFLLLSFDFLLFRTLYFNLIPVFFSGMPAWHTFHRHLGPNLLIFAVKVSPWFHRHFTVLLWHITDISPRKNTDQGDFLLKRAVRAVDKILSVTTPRRKSYVYTRTCNCTSCVLLFIYYFVLYISIWYRFFFRDGSMAYIF